MAKDDQVTLAQFRELKKVCEKEILQAIEGFSKATGFTVDDVTLQSRDRSWRRDYQLPEQCFIHIDRDQI